MSAASEGLGTVEDALKHAARLLDDEPALAEEQATEILNVAPQHPQARLLLARARARLGRSADALELLDALARSQLKWAAVPFERALVLARERRGNEVIAALRSAVQLDPDHPEAWRLLGDHLLATGDNEGADAAYARHIKCSTRDPRLIEAASALLRNDLRRAEGVLKAHLREKPTDVPAIRLLGEVAVRVGRLRDAEHLFERCLQLAPGFAPARYNLSVLLHRENEAGRALPHVERLVADEPGHAGYRNLLAVVLGRVGQYGRASELYRQILAEYPSNPKLWMSYGHLLKTEGRRENCIEAYLQAIELEPSLGEAWWSLANMKTFRFEAADIDTIRAQLARQDLSAEDRLHFHFALGKALEDAGEWGESFHQYEHGNTLHRARNPWDAQANSERADRFVAEHTRAFFAARAGHGHESAAPIFIVGMPRSGSTLIDQIIASHSQVEGTTELPDLITLARELRDRAGGDESGGYNEILASLGAAELRALGEQYLERTRVHRRTDLPFFIDKMPNNFQHLGLIHLMLPNARIIDARRHPMACCLSNFKQHYARGQNFAYGLEDMGRYYADYVRLMAHYDVALPGRVHRVIYERTVADTEAEVRRVLDYCGLPFEQGCLRFYENDRPVRTASSEQVRQPIYNEGVDQWRQFEPWLGPLAAALGPALDSYPEIPSGWARS